MTEDVYTQIYNIIKSQKQKVIILATGSLSNVAMLVKTYPGLKDCLEYMSIMGGGIKLSNVTPVAEFNVWSDPHAAQIVFHSQIPIYLAPLDITHTMAYDQDFIDEVRKIGDSSFLKSICGALQFYLNAYKKFDARYDAPMHDPLSAYYIISPESFQLEFYNLEVEIESQISLGQTVVDTRKQTGRQPNVHILMSLPDKKRFWDLFLQDVREIDKISPVNKGH